MSCKIFDREPIYNGKITTHFQLSNAKMKPLSLQCSDNQYPSVYCDLYLESGLDIVSQILSIDRYVVLTQPVRVEYRSAQRLLKVYIREMLHGYLINVSICPCSFLIRHQSESSECEKL